MNEPTIQFSVRMRKLQKGEKGERGEDGVGAYMLDLDNENINIGLTSGGGSLYPAAGYNTGESRIYVAGGATVSPQLIQVKAYIGDDLVATATSSSDVTYSNASTGITELKLNLSRISVKFSTTVARDKGSRVEIRIEGTIYVEDSAGVRTVTAYKVLTVTFQPPGADGQTPVIYELRPAHAQVVIDASTSTRTPSSTSCDVTQRIGNSFKVLTADEISAAGLEVRYIKTTSSASPPTAGTSLSLNGVTALTWYLYHGTDIWDKEEIAFVKDGKDGTSPIVMHIEDYSITVTVSADGTPESGELPISVQARLLDGGTDKTSSAVWSVQNTHCTSSANASTAGLIDITAIDSAHKSARIKVTATYGGKSYTGNISISKSYPGQNGESPIAYALQPSALTVHLDANGNATPSTVSCSAIKRTGGNVTDVTSSLYMEYSHNKGQGGDGGAYDGSPITVTPQSKWIKFKLWLTEGASVQLDEQTVYVVADGEQGDTGSDGHDSEVASVSPASITYTKGRQRTVTFGCKVNIGGEDYDATISSVKFGAVSSIPMGMAFNTSTKTLSIGASATWEGVLNFTLTFASKTYYASAQVNRVSDGEPGPAGLVCRVTEWAEGVNYRNDAAILAAGNISQSENGAGVYYLDIVVINEQGRTIGAWQCLSTHTSSAEFSPLNEAFGTNEESAHWKTLSMQRPLYTPLLLADNAVIGFVQGQSLRVYNGTQLKAGIQAASGGYPIFYAAPESETDDDIKGTSKFQIFESGNAQFGNPSGSKILLNANPGTGYLPRMEIYDTSGNPSAIYDGTRYDNISAIFPNGTSTTDGSIASNTATMTFTGNVASGSIEREFSTSVTCNVPSALSVDASTYSYWGSCSEGKDNAIGITVALEIDGSQYRIYNGLIDVGETISQSNARAFSFSSVGKIAVSAGTHTVKVRITACRDTNLASNAGEANVKLNGVSVHLSVVGQRCLYFANGLAIGSASDNYCIIWDNNGDMNFRIQNQYCYLEVTADGVKIKQKGETTPRLL